MLTSKLPGAHVPIDVAASPIARLPGVARTGMARLVPTGQAAFTRPGTYIWVCPPGVYFVNAVAVGAGHYGGGGLGWKNLIPVVPGRAYRVQVGRPNGNGAPGDSFFITLAVVAGRGGFGGGPSNGGSGGGAWVGDGGGYGGNFGVTGDYTYWEGGGGAGGYTGNGGQGANADSSWAASPTGYAGNGGAGGGGHNLGGVEGNGGGVGLLGQGGNGTGHYMSNGGSGGGSGITGEARYGGGMGYGGTAGGGAVRIIWPAATRLFPGNQFGQTRDL